MAERKKVRRLTLVNAIAKALNVELHTGGRLVGNGGDLKAYAEVAVDVIQDRNLLDFTDAS